MSHLPPQKIGVPQVIIENNVNNNYILFVNGKTLYFVLMSYRVIINPVRGSSIDV